MVVVASAEVVASAVVVVEAVASVIAADEVEGAVAVVSVIVEVVAVELLPTVEASATSLARRRLSKSRTATRYCHAHCSTIPCITRTAVTKRPVMLLNMCKQG